MLKITAEVMHVYVCVNYYSHVKHNNFSTNILHLWHSNFIFNILHI